MKKFFIVFVCLLASVGIVIGLSYLEADKQIIKGQINDDSLVSQEILYYGDSINAYKKVYHKGRLIGVLSNPNAIEDALNVEKNQFYKEGFNCEVTLDAGVYVVEEASTAVFANNDEEIIQYLFDNDLIGYFAYEINIIDDEKVKDVFYIQSIDDFYEARDKFILNFVEEETLIVSKNHGRLDDVTSFGSKEIAVDIKEKITYKKAIVSKEDILINADEIYEYLCYGKNKNREYYTIKDGDTLDYVGYFHGMLTAKQIYSMNRDVLSSMDQILSPGLVLNITYFTSPITVLVTKQRYVQEKIAPEAPVYITKFSLKRGEVIINIKEVTGLKNTKYEETWANGIYVTDFVISSELIREPKRGEVWLGLGAQHVVGTGDYIWPVDYPHLNYGYLSYTDIHGNPHEGIDLINLRNPNGPVYAADTGTVVRVGYDPYQNGNWVMINHNNGYQTLYAHMRDWPLVEVGQAVNKGDQIGIIGSTGLSSGRHLHWGVYMYWSAIDPCSVTDCNQVK